MNIYCNICNHFVFVEVLSRLTQDDRSEGPTTFTQTGKQTILLLLLYTHACIPVPCYFFRMSAHLQVNTCPQAQLSIAALHSLQRKK